MPAFEEVARAIFHAAHAAHAHFDREVWQANPAAHVRLNSHSDAPSYHNQSHIRAVTTCAEALLLSGDLGNDPFGVEEARKAWARRAGGTAVSLSEVSFAVHVAFSCHDLGNVTRSGRVGLDGDGRLSLDLAPFYDSSTLYPRPEVEIRSAEIATAILSRFLNDSAERAVFTPLVSHLVLQTVFHFEKVSSDEPFWLLMQTIDMIGSYFFTPTPRSRSVAGLFNEMRIQKSGNVRVAAFMSSLRQRFELLLPDAGRQADVLSLFERNGDLQDRESVFAVSDDLARLTDPRPYEEGIRVLLNEG